MSVLVSSSGTVTASSGGGEVILYTATDAGVYSLLIDTVNMGNGDVHRLRAKTVVLSSTDLTRTLYDATYAHAQAERLKCSPPIVAPYGVSFTITQSSESTSTGRAFDYNVATIA